MILKRRISLAGIQLDSLDNRIIITGIDEAAGKDTIQAVSTAGGFGQRITNMRRDTLDVTVKFALAIKRTKVSMMTERNELLEEIAGWAAKNANGVLRVNYRPGRCLMHTVLVQAPGHGDSFNWTNEYTMVFRAYTVPYWVDDANTSVKSKSGAASGSLTLTMPGTADSVAEASIANVSGKAISSLSLTIAGKKMTFSGTNFFPAGSTLTIDHVWTNKIYYFRARVGGTSVLANRSGADDFVVSPGNVSISWTADRAVSVTVNARGRYL
jgi:hypothetical protein